MKTIQLISAALISALVMNPISGRADDIDLYSGNSGAVGTPNVMFVVDNPSSQNANVGPCTYWDGTTPSEGDKAIGNDQCALANVVHGMATNTDGSALFNLGITTMAGVIFKLTPVNDSVYTGSYSVPGGTTNRQAIILAVKALATNSGKSGQGSELQETWAYYTGGNGGSSGVGMLSGVSYPGTNAATGCQKNYAIYLSAVKSNASHAQDNNESPLLFTAIDNAVAASSVTAAQGVALKVAIPNNTQAGWGREWARYMYSVDDVTAASGVQSIITYSLATGDTAVPPAAITNDMEKYIQAVALYGGGKYFGAGTSYTALYQYLLRILNEIQAVNSVFAAASLPVSVNARGTYLNQIFIGMFRPDASGLPRWPGNLKQYKIGYIAATNSAELVDSQGVTALNSTTGFIDPGAVTYWTTKDTSVQPDSGGGFWKNTPGSATSVGGGYDSPDGELVEKGGAAQVLRLANLHNDYTATAGTSTNPRKMYTYCPSGTSCVAALSDASNAFATTNVNITASMLGSSNISVKTIDRTGTTALVTTNTPHNYTTGDSVTISGATQSQYNITQNITVNSATTFTITGLPDLPTPTSVGTYIASKHNAAAQTVSSITRSSSATTAGSWSSGCTPNLNCETATVTTSAAHTFIAGNGVTITGASPSDYSGNKTVVNKTTYTFTYSIPVYPTTPAANSYNVVVHPYSRNISSITKFGVVTTSVAHGFHVGQSITISGTSDAAYFDKTWSITAVTSTTFTINTSGNHTSTTGSVVPSTTPVTISTLSRAATTVAATATATGLTAGLFANGDQVDITTTGTAANEDAYVKSAVTITCTTSPVNTVGGPCTGTTFTYPITVTPAVSASGTMSVALSGSPAAIAAGKITRSGATATVTLAADVTGATASFATDVMNVTNAGTGGFTIGQFITSTGVPAGTQIASLGTGTGGTGTYNLSTSPGTIAAQAVSATSANIFANDDSLDISASGTVYSTESAYTGTFKITCSGTCKTFTYPVTLTPVTPATGTITAFSGTVPPDKTSVVNWVRGQDNLCDEASPDTGCPNQTAINIRPSLHGDVLHSRPAVVNYGGTIGVVVFYGANDTAFRAVNGNQTNPLGSTLPAPGSELWSFIPTEFYGELTRLHDNSPVLLLSTTPPGISPTPRKKDYFVDGSTSVYQKGNADGTTNAAYIYLSMRRGGSLLYALDVTTPTNPAFKWKISQTGLTTPSGLTASTDFDELGQTWSSPTVAFVKGYANPVLIFGAGYDTNEDIEPPATGGTTGIGRGIFIVDALTGSLVWKATYGAISLCSGTSTKASCTVSGMKYSIPSDITLVDRSGNDGYADRLYATDTGGNIWRVDLEPTAGNTPDHWQVTKLAALGCSAGVCASGTTPRKFLYPVDMVSGSTFDAILIGSGDREHPLYKNTLSYNVTNRFYMVKDPNIGNDGSSLTTPYTEADLKDITPISPATDTSYDGTLNGYRFTLPNNGEQVVNAPTTASGYTSFATNQPAGPNANSCTTGLGIARGYRIKPLSGSSLSSVIYTGGGFPPTAVSGSVVVKVNGVDKIIQFCMGCGANPNCVGSGCKSQINIDKLNITVSTKRNRTYWYKE